MKKAPAFLLIVFLLQAAACRRQLSVAEIKDNLERSMTGYLQSEQGPNAGSIKFKMEEVNYFEEKDFFICEFKVKLFRPDGSDTTGAIKARISKDFSKVTKR
jgi:hypothetical protein